MNTKEKIETTEINTTPKAPLSVLIMDLRNKLYQLANYPEISPTVIEMAFGEVYKAVQEKALNTLKTEYDSYRTALDTVEKLKEHNEKIESEKGK